jgi:hypothetical protein
MIRRIMKIMDTLAYRRHPESNKLVGEYEKGKKINSEKKRGEVFLLLMEN